MRGNGRQLAAPHPRKQLALGFAVRLHAAPAHLPAQLSTSSGTRSTENSHSVVSRCCTLMLGEPCSCKEYPSRYPQAPSPSVSRSYSLPQLIPAVALQVVWCEVDHHRGVGAEGARQLHLVATHLHHGRVVHIRIRAAAHVPQCRRGQRRAQVAACARGVSESAGERARRREGAACCELLLKLKLNPSVNTAGYIRGVPQPLT
jgi:hypothetical protein